MVRVSLTVSHCRTPTQAARVLSTLVLRPRARTFPSREPDPKRKAQPEATSTTSRERKPTSPRPNQAEPSRAANWQVSPGFCVGRTVVGKHSQPPRKPVTTQFFQNAKKLFSREASKPPPPQQRSVTRPDWPGLFWLSDLFSVSFFFYFRFGLRFGLAWLGEPHSTVTSSFSGALIKSEEEKGGEAHFEIVEWRRQKASCRAAPIHTDE